MSSPNKRVFAFDRVNFILLAVGMAVVILGGLITSTILNMFVVPAIYLITNKKHETE